MIKLVGYFLSMCLFFNATIVIAEEAVKEAVAAVPAEATVAVVDLAEKIPLPPEQAPWWVEMGSNFLGQFPEVNGWIVAILLFLSVGLRASAELLLFISTKTENTWDNKLAATLSKSTAWAAAVLGWFGGGKPKGVDKKSGTQT